MSESTVRCWLVEREFDARNVVTLVYATPDGSRYHQREQSANALRAGSGATAAREILEADLETVPDEKTRERYATEAERTASQHDPADPI